MPRALAFACLTVWWLTTLKVDFYYLTRTPLDRALPAIAERALAGGGRLAILADDTHLLDHLDKLLWTYRAASFLPHGRDGEPPVLLVSPDALPQGYPNIAFIDGIWRSPPESVQRVFYFFEAPTLDQARAAWRGLSDTSAERRYWKQDETGRWIEGP